MATLIPEVELSDFQKLPAEIIKTIKCCEVYDNGEYVFTAIIPGTGFIRASAESAADLSNSVAGENPGEVIAKAVPIDPWENAEVYVSDKSKAVTNGRKHQTAKAKNKV